jgi:DNA-binding NarL/FixJ family response regulator
MPNDAPISILVVDDHQITRTGLKLMLQLNAEFDIVGDAEDGVTAVSKALALRPDVILMDIGLPKVDGIEATRQIKAAAPDRKVIMLSSHDGADDIDAALGAGADGYCFKDVSIDALVHGIKTVKSGASWLDARIMQRMSKVSNSNPQSHSKEDKWLITSDQQQSAGLTKSNRNEQNSANSTMPSGQQRRQSSGNDTPRLQVADAIAAPTPTTAEVSAELTIGNAFAGRVTGWPGRNGFGLSG